MSNEKIAKIIIALDEKTDLSQVVWGESSISGYEAYFPRYTARIREQQEYERDSFNMVLEIINDSGEVIESLTDDDLSDYLVTPFTIMHNLFQKARRSAMGVDEAVDEILNFLENS